MPALRYIVQLNAPGLSIIGAGEPALPGVSFGHNDQVGWGLTIFNTDQEDLYVYTLKPGDPNYYRYGGGYEADACRPRNIEVKGEAPRTIELRFTRHGPVLMLDAAKGRAFAIRTVWNEPGVSGYLGSSRMWHAKSWNGFRPGRECMGRAAAQSCLCRHARKYWLGAGRPDSRASELGRADAGARRRPLRVERISERRISSSAFNPKEGWFATANEMNLPAGYPAEQRNVSFEWSDPTRITASRPCSAAKLDAQPCRLDGACRRTATVRSPRA